ncbi:MAG: hypothetical protein WD767_04510 [Alphaproteobacteria bacterium]
MTSVIPGDRDLNSEIDSLHILPMHFLPLKTPGLRHARMIKNARGDSMVELFHDSDTGSGQVDPSRLARMFDWPVGEKHPDGVLIAKLSLMQSFDVYTLRMQLRGLGIEVENIDDLRLSDRRRQELDRYMRVFTRPLMDLIYSQDEQIGLASISDLIASFNRGDNRTARENLNRLAGRLKIILAKLPAFLTDYGDVFLSLAYFKDQFDRLVPRLDALLRRIEELKRDEICRSDRHLKDMLTNVSLDLNEIMAHIAGRIQSFDKHTESMWQNLSEETFRKVKIMIESNHGTIGGMLCGLYVKIQGYEEKFGESETSNQVLVDYITAYIKPGIDRIKSIERSARLAEHR